MSELKNLLYMSKEDFKNIGIFGHPKRGDEVISFLEMIGGKQKSIPYDGRCSDKIYYVGYDGYINSFCPKSTGRIYYLTYRIETLDALYPYKLKDYVLLNNGIYGCISKIYWNKEYEEFMYDIEAITFNRTYEGIRIKDIRENLKMTHKKMVLDEKQYGEKFELILGDYEIVEEDGKTYAVLKDKYPKTYNEACKYLGLDSRNLTYSNIEVLHAGRPYYEQLLAFERLMICKDAFCKAHNNWTPDWSSKDKKFAISLDKDNDFIFIEIENRPRVFSFPTKEIAQKFYDRFIEDLEICKKFI